MKLVLDYDRSLFQVFAFDNLISEFDSVVKLHSFLVSCLNGGVDDDA